MIMIIQLLLRGGSTEDPGFRTVGVVFFTSFSYPIPNANMATMSPYQCLVQRCIPLCWVALMELRSSPEYGYIVNDRVSLLW